MKLHLLLLFSLASCLLSQAQVPNLLNYQGRVAVGTTNFDGTGQFKFALVNGTGSTTYWSNNGSSSGGSEPTAAVSLTVTKGLYSVQLGDTTLANMTAVPASVFNNADVRLRVWFNDGTNGFQLLTPDQRITSTGYAIRASTASMADAARGLDLPGSSSGSSGTVTQNGIPLLHTGGGASNVFLGQYAGSFSLSASENTVIGTAAFGQNQTGDHNTTAGYWGLSQNLSGNDNTALGWGALYSNSSGSNNIALGYLAGGAITSTNNNIDIGNQGEPGDVGIIRIGTPGTHMHTYLTGVIHGDGSGLMGISATNVTGTISTSQIASGAVGSSQLASGLTLSGTTTGTFAGSLNGNVAVTGTVALPATSDSATGLLTQNGARLLHTFGTRNLFAGIEAGNFTMTGIDNTAAGFRALQNNTSGIANTANGRSALLQNQSGDFNTAVGYRSLEQNTTGDVNTALGDSALTQNQSGSWNVAIGSGALRANTSGGSNIAVGTDAGANLTTGFSNIDIGNSGVAGESGIIRIGTTGTHTDTYLAGVIRGNGSGLTNISATNFSGTLGGDVTGTQGATSIAATVVTSKQLTGFASTTGTITASDSILSAINKLNGNIGTKASLSGATFSGTVTAPTFSGSLSGNATTATLALGFSGALAGDVVGTQSSTSVSLVGGVAATSVAAGANLANAATSANTANAIVKRDGSGGFSAGTITGTFVGDGSGLTSLPMLAIDRLHLPATTGSATWEGTIIQDLTGWPGDASLIHTYGSYYNAANFFAGFHAGNFNLTGVENNGVGRGSLNGLTSGSNNSALGSGALQANSSGSDNTGVGWHALLGNTSGANNIGIGSQAGKNLGTGSNNIDIGNQGVTGDAGVVRIGTPGTHAHTHLAGVIHGDGSGLTNLPSSARGNYVIGTSTGNSTNNSTLDVAVAGTNVSITTTGRPVMVCMASGGTSAAYVGVNGAAGAQATFTLWRDGVQVGAIAITSVGPTLVVPPGSVNYVDLAPPGSHTYEIKGRYAAGGGGAWFLFNSFIVVHEL